MKFIPLSERFSVCKVADYSQIDLACDHVFIGKTANENSLVCPVEKAPRNATAREDGWKGFYVEGTLDFSLVGILAAISTALAQKKIGIFAVSTYDTDYIFVKEENFAEALKAVENL